MGQQRQAIEPALAQGWCALAALHNRLEAHIERALQSEHDLSVREFAVLDVLDRQDGYHLRMNELSEAVVLSQSATTRLVTRLEERGLLSRYLCDTDRRGIYTEVTSAGCTLLTAARPTHDRALRESLADAEQYPELAPLVLAVKSVKSPAR
ncbi:MarR family winged helix-turn-helix transcriptional regulator [Embleya sp. AB8]|uniref:MarR family winged helix-turn-helix transcriptional regulator n=1 Tax=Embleya sp. AB8 TaxID=3156304 RepID=UPI003C776F8E